MPLLLTLPPGYWTANVCYLDAAAHGGRVFDRARVCTAPLEPQWPDVVASVGAGSPTAGSGRCGSRNLNCHAGFQSASVADPAVPLAAHSRSFSWKRFARLCRCGPPSTAQSGGRVVGSAAVVRLLSRLWRSLPQTR